ncbi:hypothetical protein MKD33_07675, partial [Chromobacterium piscinae]
VDDNRLSSAHVLFP